MGKAIKSFFSAPAPKVAALPAPTAATQAAAPTPEQRDSGEVDKIRRGGRQASAATFGPSSTTSSKNLLGN